MKTFIMIVLTLFVSTTTFAADVYLSTPDTTGFDNSDNVLVRSGNTENGYSGIIETLTGQLSDTNNEKESGWIVNGTGGNVGTYSLSKSGSIWNFTGPTVGGNSGDYVIETGNSENAAAGNIYLTPGVGTGSVRGQTKVTNLFADLTQFSADPCASGNTAKVFYSTSGTGELCFCNDNGDDKKVASPSTDCF